ncbi:MAG TPA: proprotein convertase P-domain-containing protein [Verrucomicrobiae bacterium]|nr:proprotein convertase P-domain-containing protein [Verrucomicrobiae bacterium]
MKKTSLAFIGMVALLAQGAFAQELYTTTNDFFQWQAGSGFPEFQVASQDSDGSIVNGIGNTNFPGGAGGGGALAVQWPQGGPTYAYTANTAGEQGRTNFIAALEQTNKVFTFDYTTPGTNGTYFQLGIVVNCEGRFDQLFPTSTTSLGGGWTRATIDWSGEATNLINQQSINTSNTFSYFQLILIYNSDHANTTPFYVDNFAIRNPSPPPVALFTTTNDFTGWTTEPDASSVGPTNFDSDGAVTNGLGNTTAAGAVGTPGSLNIVWASNTFGTASYGPYEQSNTAFIAAIERASTLFYDFTTPPIGTGTYFEVGIVVDYSAVINEVNTNGFDELFPSATTPVSNGFVRASIDWSSEAQKLSNQFVASASNAYFRIGVVWNSDYAPGGVPFQMDNFTVITNSPAAYIIPTNSTIVSQNCATPNGAINPGETVAVDFALANTGNVGLSNVTATLLPTGGVVLPSGQQSYGTLASYGGSATNSFTFTADNSLTCGGNLIATLQLQTNSVFYRTVPYNFTLGTLGLSVTNSYSSGGESVAIPDNTPVGITNSINVTATGAVSHVTVSLRINHTYEGDLQMYLIHPDGTMVELKAADPAGSGANFGSGATDCTGTFTVFDDSATTPIASGFAPFTLGPYKPAQPLSTVNGKPAQGAWKLYIEDTGPGDTGTLYCWQLQIADQPYLCCSGFVTPTDSYTAWASHYFPSDGPSALGTHTNANGVLNTNLFLAGFNPTNNAAYPHITAIARSGAAMNVTYLAANGDNSYTGGPTTKTNVLEFSTGVPGTGVYSNNFQSTGQTNILSGGNGNGVITVISDPSGATGATRYYRIRVIAP